MLKKYSWLLLALFLTGAIWFLTPVSHPEWIKNSFFVGLALYLLLLFLFFSKFPTRNSDERPYFGLTEKLYNSTLMGTFIIYTAGIWVITPATHPSWIKNSFLGFGLVVLIGFFLYFTFKKVGEKPDDRFFTNLAKAASLTLALTLFSLFLLSIITIFISFTIKAGMLLIFSSVMILVFDFSFFLFEKRGE